MNLNPLNYYALDVEHDFDIEKNSPIMVITFTPRKNRFGHFHIEIDKQHAQKLFEWLYDFLESENKEHV